MGKSKRNKLVSLTKTKKKTKDFKELLVEKIKENIEKYENVFVFSHENMRTNPFRDIQQTFSDSKFFLGKNKIMQKAIGQTEEESYKKNLFLLSEHLKGDCGLFLTNRNPKEIQKYFDEYQTEEFAKAGTVADQNLILEKGSNVFFKFSHSMEPYLRKLGVNTSLVDTEIHLNENYILAEKGKELNSEQCKLLKLLNLKIAEFKIGLLGFWNKKGIYKKLIS